MFDDFDFPIPPVPEEPQEPVWVEPPGIKYTELNANKFHDELIAAGVIPLSVMSKDADVWVNYPPGTNMDIVGQVLAAHGPTPLPPPLSEQLQQDLAIAEAYESLYGEILTTSLAIAEVYELLVGGA